MREILFRGKRIDNGEWVEGNLFIPDSDSRPIQILCGTDIVRIACEIDTETVGQYTGLTDKNGKKVFEGDIVRNKNTNYVVKYFDQFMKFAPTNDKCVFTVFSIYRSEVIGNVYDNPELLKENENA